MPEETGIQENASAEENQEKTFTQDELNDIIQKRLNRQKNDYEEKIAKLEQQLTDTVGEKESEDNELETALKELEELRNEKTAREEAEKRNGLIADALKAHNVASEFAPLLNHVPEDQLDDMATLLGKRFSEPSKNERKRADVKAPEDKLKEWASEFMTPQN